MDDWEVHCKIVGVKKDASLDDIKKAYRESAKILHPDKHQNNSLAKEKFQDLKKSYDYLSSNHDLRHRKTKSNVPTPETSKQKEPAKQNKTKVWPKIHSHPNGHMNIDDLIHWVVSNDNTHSIQYINSILFSVFDLNMFSDDTWREALFQKRRDYVTFLDRLSTREKLELLSNAIKNPKKFKAELITRWLPEVKKQ